MQTIRRLLHREIWLYVGFVALAFLSLFAFFDLVEELSDVGKGLPERPYRINHATAVMIMHLPNHLYELLPIAVLIGTIFVMARFAQSSEFTILRTSGMGPWRALKNLLWMGLAFALITFVMGDYIAPPSVQAAQLFKSRYIGQISIGATGAWLKDKQQHSSFAVNVAAMGSGGEMKNVKLYELNSSGHIIATVQAERAQVEDGVWVMQQVQRQEFELPSTGSASTSVAKIQRSAVLPEWRWRSDINSEMVSVSLLQPERMSTYDLFQYIRHLKANAQSSQRYEIEFWRKIFYPLSCIVMVVLALPFAYLHFRSGTISGYVFLGVMLGISFFLINNVFGFMGNLRDWTPWLTAAIPGLMYLLGSLGAFAWLVLRR